MSTATATSDWTRSTAPSTADFEMPKGGSYPAVLVGMINLGTTDNTYQGKTTKRSKILFVWELTAEFDSKGQPFIVARDFTFSLKGDNSHLRKFIEGWEGKSLPDGVEYDVMGLMGRECMLNLSEGTSGNGKRFIECLSAGKVPKGLVVPKNRHEPFAWTFSLHNDTKLDPEIPDWIPLLYGRQVKDDIKKSDEWFALPAF